MTALDSTAVRTVRSVCSYCGVGCGLVVRAQQGRVIGVAGDTEHPANRGGLCSKGRSIGETLITGDRALHPMRRPLDGAGGFDRLSPWQRVSWPDALREAAIRLRALQQRHGKDSVFFYLSGQLLTEDYYVANKLVKGFLGTNNVDTNSRLCMASASVAYEMAFGSDGPPGCYDDFDHARSVLFIGSNAAETHPILFGRLLQARARTGARWVVVDPRRTATAEAADVHLNITPGSDVALLLAMFNVCITESLVDARYVRAHTAGFDAAAEVARDWPAQRAAETCGVDSELIERAARVVWSSPAALSLWCQGMNQSSAATDKNLALLNLHLATGQIGRPGAGPFSLTGQANAMGGREVGGFATKLAAHRRLDDPAARLLVQNHWGCGPLDAHPGLTAVELVDGLLDGRVRAVWIAGSNPVVSLPDAERARAALQRAEFVVVQDLYHPTDTSLLADLVLPAAAWGEKTGTMTNSERRVTLAEAAVPPRGEAREDWRIFAGLAGELGHRAAFTYRNAADVFDEHAALTKGSTCDMSGLSHDRLARDGPMQWPCLDSSHPGLERRYTDGVYATADGRARLHATPFRAPAEVPDALYPLRLTTVRTPDAWHTLTRTGKVAGLRGGSDRPTIAVHPEDASRAGLGDGDAVELVSRRGRWRGYARCTDEVPRGSVSASFHWPSLRDARAGANLVMPAALDPRSKQPELKHATVRLVRALPLDHILVIGGPGAKALARAMSEEGCGAADVRTWSTLPPAGAAWCVVADESADWEQWRLAARLPSPVVVDAGARIVGRECGHAVGAPIRTTGGLRVTDDPQRQAAAILAGGASGPRALATSGVRAEGERCTFVAGEPDDQAGDDEQGVRLLSRRDGRAGFSVTWRLAGGQVLGVTASGPRDAVQEVARAWDADLSPEELVHGPT